MDTLWAAEAVSSGGGDAGYWQLAMVLAGIGFLGFFARWRRRRAPVLPDARELRDRDREPNRYRDAADKAIVELLETSRTLNAQVDTKIRMLNRLLKDAEAASARLEQQLARLETGSGEQTAAGTDTPAEPGPAAAAAPARVFVSDLQERIFRLREDGKSAAEIAKATNLSITEVNFAVESMGDAHV